MHVDMVATPSNSTAGGRWAKAFTALCVISVFVSIGMMAIRAVSAISFAEPLLAITSGAEEESTFALWKAVHGLPVYADPYVPPFAATYYNWLFYAVYGLVTSVVLGAFTLADAWIPTIGRLVSLAFAALGAALAYRLFRPGFGALGSYGRVLAVTLAVFVFFGPLVGFWAISVHPDLPATVLGVAAVTAFLALYPLQRLPAVLAAAGLGYAAWALKQSHIFAIGAVFLFLVLRREWRLTAVLLGVSGAAIIVTLAAGSDIYRYMILYHLPVIGSLLVGGATGLVFDTGTLTRNLLNFAVKAGPLVGVAVALPMLAARGPAVWLRIMRDDQMLLAICAVLVTSVIAMPASGKLGAAENYYFPVAAFAALAMSTASPYLTERAGTPRALLAALAAGWLANAIASGMVIAGMTGVRSVWVWHERLSAQRSCIAPTPGPRFFPQTHLAVPWINPSGPYFVFAYNYLLDRAAGRSFPEGTIGALITTGYFATLAVPEGSSEHFDGAQFDRYVRGTTSCAGLWIYRRREG